VIVRSLEDASDNFVYRGHKYAIGAAQFSPNGNWIASVDAGGFLRVWAWDNPEHTTKLEVQVMGAAILDLCWDFESKRICVVGDGKGIVAKCITWDTGNAVGEMVGHNKKVLSCAFRPSRPMRIVTGAEDFRIVFYKGPPFKMDHSCTDHKNYVNCVRYNPDGSMFASVGSDKKIILYDGVEGTMLRECKAKNALKHHQGSIYSVCWHPTGKEEQNILVTVSADKTVKSWNIDSGSLQTSFSLGTTVGDMLNCILWPSTMEAPITFSLDGRLHYLNSDLTSVTKVIQAPRAPISCMTVCANNTSAIIGCNDGTIFKLLAHGEFQKFSNAALNKEAQKPCHAGKITCLCAFGTDGVATAGFDDKLKFAHLETGAYANDGLKLDGQPVDLCSSSDHSRVYTATTKGIAIVSESSGIQKFVPVSYDPTAITISDSIGLIVGAKDGILRILDPDSLNEIRTLPPHRGEITVLVLSPDKSRLAVGDADRDIKIYDLPNLNILVQSTWRFHTSRVTALAWRPDSAFLASAASDENIFIWDVQNPSTPPIKFDFTHKDGVTALSFLDQDHLLSAGNDANVLKWKPFT